MRRKVMEILDAGLGSGKGGRGSGAGLIPRLMEFD